MLSVTFTPCIPYAPYSVNRRRPFAPATLGLHRGHRVNDSASTLGSEGGPDGATGDEDPRGLLEGLRRGERRAQLAFFDRYAPQINRLVVQFLGVDQEHDDLVQQILVKALTNAHQVRNPESFHAWVVSVTVNTVRGEIRKRKARRIFGFGTLDAENHAVLAWTDDHVARDMVAHVRSVLDKMPTNEQLVFVMRHVERYALQELAKILNCSLATVKRRIAKAEKRFATLAKGDPVLAERIAEFGERRA